MPKNEEKLKAAGLRMALKLLPADLMDKAPEHFEAFLNDRLRSVEPASGEAGVCYLIAPDNEGHMQILTVGLDEQNTVTRIVGQTNMAEIFNQILDGLKKI